ncbi:MAG: hypothetical protein HKN25_03720 [Pyrinomonadaceae bacterium]|nr:hypothetical protein [Pyrinomonadaceae bacterium]
MKNNALVAFGLLVSLASAGVIVAQDASDIQEISVVVNAEVTKEQARKIALKRVPGTVEDEYTVDDDDGNLVAYAFLIKNKEDKMFEVQVSSVDGRIISVEEQKNEDEEDPDPTEEESTESEPVEETEDEATEEVAIVSDDDAPSVKTNITIERARKIAIKKSKGEIQSEELISNNRNAYFAFVIKGKKGKLTQVRVDANSGKAKKFKMTKVAEFE